MSKINFLMGLLWLDYLTSNNNNSKIMYQLLYIYNLPGTERSTVERDFFNNLYSNLRRCMLLSVLQIISFRLEVVSYPYAKVTQLRVSLASIVRTEVAILSTISSLLESPSVALFP